MLKKPSVENQLRLSEPAAQSSADPVFHSAVTTLSGNAEIGESNIVSNDYDGKTEKEPNRLLKTSLGKKPISNVSKVAAQHEPHSILQPETQSSLHITSKLTCSSSEVVQPNCASINVDGDQSNKGKRLLKRSIGETSLSTVSKTAAESETVLVAQRSLDKTTSNKRRKVQDEQSGLSNLKNNEVFTNEELEDLCRKGMPDSLSEEAIATIEKLMHDELHSPNIVCVVCDEICPQSKAQLFRINELPHAFFEVLKAPTGLNGDAEILHQDLIKQYDLREYFPNDPRFENLLLSPRGIQVIPSDCGTPNESHNQPQLYVCNYNGCLRTLRRRRIPKFSIANGNYIGQLPSQLQNLSYGSRCLLRPVHSFGRMATFYQTSGTRLTGHIYANKLDTVFVRKKLPLSPKEVPIRLVVVSPFATDASALGKAKFATMQEDYIIEPSKIDECLQFFRSVDNRIMKDI